MEKNDPISIFQKECKKEIEGIGKSEELRKASIEWMAKTADYKYTYHFSWMGRPIIQYPQDIVAMQELIWKVKPEIIIETGIAHGGSLVFYASMLELLGEGEVIGIDLDIRTHNRREIENHTMYKRIKMLEGSSTDSRIIEMLGKYCEGKERILVVLDSNHTHEHVLEELRLYSPFVTKGSYLVVMDTGIEDMPESFYSDRPWGKGNNAKTAVYEFLKQSDRFVIDEEIHSKLLITVAPDGYLKCIK